MSGFLKYFLPSVVVSDVVVLAKEGAEAPVGGQESLRAVAMVPFAHLGRTGDNKTTITIQNMLLFSPSIASSLFHLSYHCHLLNMSKVS